MHQLEQCWNTAQMQCKGVPLEKTDAAFTVAVQLRTSGKAWCVDTEHARVRKRLCSYPMESLDLHGYAEAVALIG